MQTRKNGLRLRFDSGNPEHYVLVSASVFLCVLLLIILRSKGWAPAGWLLGCVGLVLMFGAVRVWRHDRATQAADAALLAEAKSRVHLDADGHEADGQCRCS